MANLNQPLHGLLLCLSFVLGVAVTGQAETTDEIAHAAAERLFTLKVLPLIKTKCFGCHGGAPEDIRGEYVLLTRDGMLKGGESEEPSIVPGKPEESILYQAVLWDGYEMPPKENDRLTEEETEHIHDWIAAGAPWPDEQTQREITKAEWSVRENEDGVIVETSGGLADDWTYRRYDPESIWAFRPVEAVDLDAIKAADQHPIDYFIQAQLQEKKVEPAPRADPQILLRRAFFDLIGLPPTPQEVDEFLAAWEVNAEAAWEALIDRLLASPHYGERWAQHWLDVARYSDTAGYSNDYERSNMWRYRDYVIRAFNHDKPYNDFVTEQIAGDELWEQQADGRHDPELLVATSFLRMGPWDPAMVKTPEARQIYLDDVVNAVGQTFLATTMRCFKCHDHKFDPLPTRDYYRMYAAFSGTQLAERPAAFLPEENLTGIAEGEAHVRRLLEFATARKEPNWGVKPPGKRSLNTKQFWPTGVFGSLTRARAAASGTLLTMGIAGQSTPVPKPSRSPTRSWVPLRLVGSPSSLRKLGSEADGPNTLLRLFGLRKKNPPRTSLRATLPNAYTVTSSATSIPILAKILRSSLISGVPQICAGSATLVLPAAMSAEASER